MRLNRPVAVRAALRIVMRNQPSDADTRERFEAVFGPAGRMPAAARKEYAFLPPGPSLAGDRRAAWDRALAGLESARLGEVARAFDELARADPDDAAAAYNLGISRAWLGENLPALEVLERYVRQSTDDDRAAEAWALGEVLRCGYGMDEQCDYHEYSVAYQIRDARPVEALLRDWGAAHRLLRLNTGEENVFSGLILDAPPRLTLRRPQSKPHRWGATSSLPRASSGCGVRSRSGSSASAPSWSRRPVADSPKGSRASAGPLSATSRPRP